MNEQEPAEATQDHKGCPIKMRVDGGGCLLLDFIGYKGCLWVGQKD